MLPNFTRRQWSTLAIIGLADFANAICVSLQAPFFPQEVSFLIFFFCFNSLHHSFGYCFLNIKEFSRIFFFFFNIICVTKFIIKAN